MRKLREEPRAGKIRREMARKAFQEALTPKQQAIMRDILVEETLETIWDELVRENRARGYDCNWFCRPDRMYPLYDRIRVLYNMACRGSSDPFYKSEKLIAQLKAEGKEVQ